MHHPFEQARGVSESAVHGNTLRVGRQGCPYEGVVLQGLDLGMHADHDTIVCSRQGGAVHAVSEGVAVLAKRPAWLDFDGEVEKPLHVIAPRHDSQLELVLPNRLGKAQLGLVVDQVTHGSVSRCTAKYSA